MKLDYQQDAPFMGQKTYGRPTEADYEAAVREFDRLWETCTANPCAKTMKRLLAVIEAFEQIVWTTTAPLKNASSHDSSQSTFSRPLPGLVSDVAKSSARH
jgi:hypothetical protein